MTIIITGDIIKSRRHSNNEWLANFKKVLNNLGKSPAKWEIYRGDEFQIEVAPEDAILAAILIKSFLKTQKLDARLAIGVGEKDYVAKKITESNGSAFVRSGELFEKLRSEKLTLAINSADADFNVEMNLLLKFAATLMNNWLPQSAEFVQVALDNRKMSQEQLGIKLGINQAAVSRRQKRSHFELIMELETFYRTKISTIL